MSNPQRSDQDLPTRHAIGVNCCAFALYADGALAGNANVPNQEPDFLHRLFDAWSRYALAEINRKDDPARARQLLQQILDSDIQGETRDGAQAWLDEL